MGGGSPRGTVLVIDDSQIVRASLVRMLEDGGYRVHERSTPVGASAVIVRERVDVVVLDINMPVMSGARFAELLSANDRLKHVGLVLVTGDPDQLREVAGRVGADGALTKAEARTKLVGVVDELMKTRGGIKAKRIGLDLGSARIPIPVDGVLRIGRGGACDVLLDDADASREHAEIVGTGGAATIEDLDSSNGTLVNGEPVKGLRALEVDDVIQIGSSRITVFDASDRAPRDKPTLTFGKAVGD
ncbi:MAG: response regulator [Sandaracinaceae bacterium]|nr:response regulator [Sandaracinaceae bacterium]